MLIHFAHANGVPAASYQPLFDALAPHTVIAKPMFGHDPRFPVTHQWQFLADELLEFLQQEAAEPVLAVGHSMGAVLSFLAMCKAPQRFRGVLMLDPPLLWGSMAWGCKLAKLLGKMDNVTPAGKSRYRRRHWPDESAAREYFASKPLFQFEPRCFEAFCGCALKPSTQGGVELAFSVDTEVEIFRHTPDNLKRQRPPAQIPVQVIYGDRSDASLSRCVEPFARHFGYQTQRIAGEHMYPLQQPDQTVGLIKAFAEASASQ